MNQSKTFDAVHYQATVIGNDDRRKSAFTRRLAAIAAGFSVLGACGSEKASGNEAKAEAALPVASAAEPEQDVAQNEYDDEAEFYAAGRTDEPSSLESTRVLLAGNGAPLCCVTIGDVVSLYRNSGNDVTVQEEGEVIRLYITDRKDVGTGMQTFSFIRKDGGVEPGDIIANGRRIAARYGQYGLMNTSQFLRSRFPNLQVDVQAKERLARELEQGRAKAKRDQECVDYAMSAERMAKYDDWAPPACPPGR